MWNYEKFACPVKHGSRYFYKHNSGLQNQSVVYYQESLNAERKVLIDPNKFSDDGTVALHSLIFSKDGSRLAYGVSESGSDWVKIKLLNVDTNEYFPETLNYLKFSNPAWTHDNKGVFYGKYNAESNADGAETNANENQKVYYHRIGETQENDVLVAEIPDEPKWSFSTEVSDCGNYLVLSVFDGCSDNLLYIADLRKTPEINQKLEFTKVVTKFEADYNYITNEGSIFYFRTNNGALNYRVVTIDLNSPSEENWTTLIEEHQKNVLNEVLCANKNKLILSYMEDVKSVVHVHSLETGKFDFKIPLELGTIKEISCEKESSEIFLNFESFLVPEVVYHYDFVNSTAEPVIFKESKLAGDFNREDYIVEQKFYPSKDGEKIPMFIIRKKEDEVKPRPCLIYGYGGYNSPIQPCFSIPMLAFVDLFDGILAYPSLRGGGEYGKRWHTGGSLLNKQNVFNDFQAAAEYLTNNNYTSKDRLAIQGHSNGGLLIGACINQRPELFGAAIAEAGVLDMLRYHKFTVGSAWITEFGCSDEEIHFKNLLKYSPLHNVNTPNDEKDEYPATLIMTGDHDDRVLPLHSLKFAASLQYAVHQSMVQKKPILLRVYSKSGHGFGKPLNKLIEEATDILTFLFKTLKIEQQLP